MSERLPAPYDNIARKWLALAERRREHFVDICNSGRWKHYYSQAQLREELRRIITARDEWAKLAGAWQEEEQDPPESQPGSESSFWYRMGRRRRVA